MTFRDFWTNENNPKLENFLYGPRHIRLLFSVIIITTAISLLLRKRSEKTKWRLLVVCATILLFFEISSRIVNLIIADKLNWEKVLEIMLPLHICSVIVQIFIIAVYTRRQVLINFACVCGFLSTLAFLLYPNVGINRKYMSFTCLYSTCSHSIGFMCAIWFIVFGFAKFEYGKFAQMLYCFVFLFLWGIIADFVIFRSDKADYMYLRNDPLGLNLPFPYYYLYAMMILIYINFFYLIPLFKKAIGFVSVSRQNEKL